MKETYYFTHDYSASGDPKLQALISEHGAAGYGIYWYTIELLHQEETHWLPLKEYMYLAIAKQMVASAEQVESIIKYCIMVCELFVVCDEMFTSNRVLRNFELRAKLSEKRSIAGKIGAIAKQNLASAKQNLAKSSKGKERKGKEIKEIEDISLSLFPDNGNEECQQFGSKLIFDEFRKSYVGTKKGLDTEYNNFVKKTKDHKMVLPVLMQALTKYKQWREDAAKAKVFVPEWKNLQTWINNRCWEDELPKIIISGNSTNQTHYVEK